MLVALKEARKNAVAAINSGQIQHEPRDAIALKNLLAIGAVTTDDALLVINACKGDDYSTSQHHHDATVAVHVFKAKVKTSIDSAKENWYVKIYFLDPDIWFISMHKSE